jgi:hypothetical protein
MTFGTLDIEEIKKHLRDPDKGIPWIPSPTVQTGTEIIHLSGKDLARRLEGLFTSEEADTFERNINESCEQEND